MRNSPRFLLVFVLILGLTSAGFILRSSDSYFLIKKNFTIFSEVYESVANIYVDEVDPDRLIRRGIDAMLEELDPYTVLIDESESRRMDMVTTGQYAGVGLEVGARGGRLVVIAPTEGYSAERRGVRAGDVIVKADGIDVERMSPEDLQSLLRGDPGTTVILTIRRTGIEELLDFELTREIIEVRNVSYAGLLDTEPRIGYIHLSRFAQNAAEEVRDAILELQEEEPLEALVLDLRNNPGGLLEESVRIIDKFVPAGERVVWTEGRLPRANQTYETSETPVFPDRPLIVLQNNGSASASEIVSGALQDLDRAVVVGERSFGKGLVQIVRELSYNTSLKITTSKYYMPSGRSIQSSPFVTEEELAGMDVVPDSLRTPFTTRSGRTVYEGIGIEPDVSISMPRQSMLEIALLQNSHYFFFASEYTADHDSLPPGLDLNEVYSDFLTYLDEQDFSYTTRAERHLKHVLESLEEALGEDVSGRIADMEELIALKKEHQLEQDAETIRRELYLELLSRFEGHSGRIRESLKTDPVALGAVELLQDSVGYATILKP
ncbi:S41 family peptidase [Balneolales bacterium ANBcel1]|nr:S41 family peptidase [Balneolales bacterium ANBcel1]